MTLSWGVQTVVTPSFASQEEMVDSLDQYLRGHGLVEPGERVVILSGLPMGEVGKTNNLRVHKLKALDEN